MTTVVGLNDKFLIYLSDNRIEEKGEKGAFHSFNLVEIFFSCTVFPMSKT